MYDCRDIVKWGYTRSVQHIEPGRDNACGVERRLDLVIWCVEYRRNIEHNIERWRIGGYYERRNVRWRHS